MATFNYKAVTASGRLMTGSIEAGGHDEARDLLRGMQLAVQSVERARPARPRTPIGRSELLLFNQQLASIAKAGIPLERSLRELASDAASAKMRRLIESVAADLESGMDLPEAFEKRRGLFPPLYGRIIEAGVRSGRLGEMLTSLNRHTETAGRTRRIVFEALCYPAVVILLCAGILTFLLATVVPRFIATFREMGTPMPEATRLLAAAADNIGWIWLGIGAFAAMLVLLRILLGEFAAGRRLKETITCSVPVIGRLWRDSILSRLADAMALLVGAGCDMPTCLRLAGGASGSELVRRECEALAERVDSGQGLLEARDVCRFVPGLFLYSVELGSKRNELADNLYGLSQMYGDQAKVNQGRLQVALLPALLLVVGVFVGAAILGLFLPIIHLFKGMQMGGY